VGWLSASAFPFPAQASTIVYTDPADFAAATSIRTTYGFNGILAPGETFAGFNPLIVGPLSFSDPANIPPSTRWRSTSAGSEAAQLRPA
jgi:hypothetical protein